MKYAKPLILFKYLLKTNSTKPGRLLGLDVGSKHIGLAVSDQHNKIASPLSVLLRNRSNIEWIANGLQSLAFEHSVTGFVVGYPFDGDRATPEAIHIKILMADLCNISKLEGIKYTYWDKSFTSKEVKLLLKNLNLHPKSAKSISDKFVAVEILQGYLDYVNKELQREMPESRDYEER